jgi:hypothetical protein
MNFSKMTGMSKIVPYWTDVGNLARSNQGAPTLWSQPQHPAQ